MHVAASSILDQLLPFPLVSSLRPSPKAHRYAKPTRVGTSIREASYGLAAYGVGGILDQHDAGDTARCSSEIQFLNQRPLEIHQATLTAVRFLCVHSEPLAPPRPHAHDAPPQPKVVVL
ncbi:hypothetical protein Emed_007221 [Eimeria media]